MRFHSALWPARQLVSLISSAGLSLPTSSALHRPVSERRVAGAHLAWMEGPVGEAFSMYISAPLDGGDGGGRRRRGDPHPAGHDDLTPNGG